MPFARVFAAFLGQIGMGEYAATEVDPQCVDLWAGR